MGHHRAYHPGGSAETDGGAEFTRRARFTGRARSPRRPAFTLIELLVVIFIIVGVTAAAIGTLATSTDTRRIADARSMVSGALGAARSRAVELGRPVGVTFPRPVGRTFADRIEFSEVPAPFSGGYPDSEVHCGGQGDQFSDTNGNGLYDAGEPLTVDVNGDNNYQPFGITGFSVRPAGDPAGDDPVDDYWKGILRNGDLIKFNHQGHLYRIWAPASDMDPVTRILTGDPTNNKPWALYSETTWTVPTTFVAYDMMGAVAERDGLSYTIYRQPTRSPDQPLLLPLGMVVDLEASNLAGTGDVTIVISPSGSVESIYNGNNMPYRPTEPITLLIGRDPASLNPGEAPNHQNPALFWVTIGTVNAKVSEIANPALPIYTVGADGGWGKAGVDDNGGGGTDEPAEAGAAGSDDVLTTQADVRRRVIDKMGR